jgi:hypothetical protein
MHRFGFSPVPWVFEPLSARRTEYQRGSDLADCTGNPGNDVAYRTTGSGKNIDERLITRHQRNRFRCEWGIRGLAWCRAGDSEIMKRP